MRSNGKETHDLSKVITAKLWGMIKGEIDLADDKYIGNINLIGLVGVAGRLAY